MTEAVDDSSPMRSFVEQVQHSAGLSSFEEADALVRATLKTLAEAVTGGQIDDLTEGLPQELRNELTGRSGQARSMDKDGFLDRVSGAVETTDLDRTERYVRAVLQTVRAWVPEGETSNTMKQLPSSLVALFD